MKKNKKQPLEVPPIETLEKELHRELYKKSYRSTLRSTVYTLITVAAVAVLVATLVLPVLQIYGTSMTPTLSDGDIVVSVSGSEFEAQDIIAFYYNNKILVKRVIATAGQWVDIDEEGNVSVDGTPLDEPYVFEKALGECEILTCHIKCLKEEYLLWVIIEAFQLTVEAHLSDVWHRSKLLEN